MPRIEYAEPAKRRQVTPPHIPLQAVRIRLGMKQADVCEQVSVILGKSFTVAALSAIEKGHRGASAEVLTAIQTALGLVPDSLVVDYTPSHSRRKAEDPAA